jgi:hypothetical protein
VPIAEPQITVPKKAQVEPRARTLTVVVPVLNEARGLAPLVERLRPVLERLDPNGRSSSSTTGRRTPRWRS